MSSSRSLSLKMPYQKHVKSSFYSPPAAAAAASPDSYFTALPPLSQPSEPCIAQPQRVVAMKCRKSFGSLVFNSCSAKTKGRKMQNKERDWNEREITAFKASSRGSEQPVFSPCGMSVQLLYTVFCWSYLFLVILWLPRLRISTLQSIVKEKEVR